MSHPDPKTGGWGAPVAIQAWRYLIVGLVALSVSLPVSAQPPAELKADAIVVYKARRTLLLMQHGLILHRFPIALGPEPEGDKHEEGDWRTPAGRYTIDWRNPHSRFYKSLHISYPDAADVAASTAEGMDTGGMIMIHGHPRKRQPTRRNTPSPIGPTAALPCRTRTWTSSGRPSTSARPSTSCPDPANELPDGVQAFAGWFSAASTLASRS